MRRSRVVFVVVAAAAAACVHAQPKPPPPLELPVATAAAFAGTWVTSDDLDWSYRMTVGADNTMTVAIDRGKMGGCDQHGPLVPAGDHLFTITFDKNTCGTIATATFKVQSFTGDALNMALTADGLDERHRYTRAPSQEPATR